VAGFPIREVSLYGAYRFFHFGARLSTLRPQALMRIVQIAQLIQKHSSSITEKA
jgi:hypothetical protein